jgi:enamine deaminase RidA (YjgF/YER057c/UK114 family)
MLLAHGIEIASNQVCFSLLDRRAAGALSAVAQAGGVAILAFGTLAGGFLSTKWAGAREPSDIADWSRMKYKRFIDAAGGWERFQALLGVLVEIADKHAASVANVASAWVLGHAGVAATIVGARLGEAEHRSDNLRALDLALDAEDRARIDAMAGTLDPIPGDCGDEYRKPPFLTASGDLSHHLDALPPVFPVVPVPSRPVRRRAESGSVWEARAGFSRAMRIGDRIVVSGTTATAPGGRPVCPDDAAGQAVYALDKIIAAIEALGGSAEDVIRTRVYLSDAADWEAVSAVHARYFGDTRPANTLIAGVTLIGGYKVEIEAEALVEPGD